ncbi:hypothetical protein [Streptomyces olivochromogenes]|uniref:hypothetical protein n=1 Tax=Streptomyces olivochromogenes TaxID=1963 RepID=UPI0036AB9DC3
MAGACGRTYRVDPTIDPAPCNALTQTVTGLLVPGVEIEADPGLTVTAPAPGDCPQTWTVGIDGSWAQGPWTGVGVHDLNGADRVYETITEVAPMVIPRSGVWEVNYAVRGGVLLPANLVASEYVVAALFENGSLIVGEEVMVVGLSRGQATGAAMQVQGTGAQAFLRFFNAGDQVTLRAYRIGQLATAQVISNGDGRTRIMAHWIGPTGDTPA